MIMTNEEILNYFSNLTVYVFTGTLQELKELQESENNSYNYLIVKDTIYFTAEKSINNKNIVIFTGE